MLVGEAPGESEERAGTPFVGKAGAELTYLLSRGGVLRDDVYITNVAKCRPPKNRDPKDDELDGCSHWLVKELAMVRPKVVVTVGRIATRVFLGDVDMDMVHGLPYRSSWMESTVAVVPVYHPAWGLHQPEKMILVHGDFEALGGYLSGRRPMVKVTDSYAGREDYRVWS
jgi:DNA polymerase